MNISLQFVTRQYDTRTCEWEQLEDPQLELVISTPGECYYRYDETSASISLKELKKALAAIGD